jgi:hypothetical protein
MGVQVGVVIGGGNIFRGLKGQDRGFGRAHGDNMGMLATLINSLALQSALEAAGDARQDPFRHGHAGPVRALHVPPRHRAARGRHRRPHRRRHRQPLLHHRQRRRRCAPPKSARKSCSRPPRSTASTTPTP